MHFKSSSKLDFDKASSIGNILNLQSSDCVDTIIAISGDIAFSGKQEEYEVASVFINKIIEIVGHGKCKFIICPGNHDCNLEEDAKVRDLIIKEILEKKSIDTEYYYNMLKPFSAYDAFDNQISSKKDTINPINKTFIFDYGDNRLLINALNSAWMSRIQLEPGQLYIPIDSLHIDKKHRDISILMMHHTLNWFVPEQQRELRNAISPYTLVLTGHEHDPSQYTLGLSTSLLPTMVEGGELSPFDTQHESSFNIIKFDCAINKFTVLCYKFSKKNKIYELASQEDWKSFPDSVGSYSVDHQLNNDFYKVINDVGAPYAHHSASILTIDDIFISPDLRVLEWRKDISFQRTELVNNFNHVVRDSAQKKLLIVGGERSGKTTLSKMFFLESLKERRTPILIDGKSITNSSIESFNKIITKNLKRQYDNFSFDMFVSTPQSQKIIIIDDYHLSPIKFSDKNILINGICNAYENIVIFVDEYMQFDALIKDTKIDKCERIPFIMYSIMPFGHRLRNQLIKRWYTIGSVQSTEDDEFHKKVDQAQAMFDTLVCKNFVPPYPFYLYTALSAYVSSNDSIAESTYAAYYTVLLITALKRIDSRPEEISFGMTYLAELAYDIFKNKNSSLLILKYELFHNAYCQKYDISRDGSKLLHQLCYASILEKCDDAIFFKYKYFYYYFLAKYFADNISQPYIQNYIIDLCASLHIDTSANVIMFLSHLSKDPMIIESIIQQAESIFSKNCPIHLDDDVAIANNLIGDIPSVILKDTSAKEAREEQLKIKDTLDSPPESMKEYGGKDIKFVDDQSCNSFNDPDSLMLSLNATYKTIDIIGLIIKTHYGSLDADTKLRLCEQGYLLPLRALADYFDCVSKHQDILLLFLTQLIKSKSSKLVSSADIDRIAKSYVFHLSELLTFSFIKKASTALGSENLKITYKKLKLKYDFPSVSLIDIAIKIDFFDDFPLNELKDLAQYFKKRHIIAFSVLRDIAIYKMYMFNLSREKRHKICSALNISTSSQAMQQGYAKEKGIVIK